MPRKWHTTAAVTLIMAILVPFMMKGQAVVSWNETTHDFGTFHESEGEQSYTFNFVNTGDSALIIKKVHSTCGCTVAQYPTDPIAPGEHSSIVVTYSPSGRPGPFKKSVLVYTNSSVHKAQLTIKGIVIGAPESVKTHFPVGVGELQFTKLTLAPGEIEKGLMRNSVSTLYNSSRDTIVISFDNNTSHIKPHAVPDTVVPGGISTMSFFFDSSLTPVWGINDDNVTVIATPLHNKNDATNAVINIVANVIEDFSHLSNEDLAKAPVCSISSNKVIINDISQDKPCITNFTLKNGGKNNLVLHRLMSLDNAITATSDKTMLKKGEQANITIRVNPSNIKGNLLNSQFTIISNDPINPRITIRVVGEKK